MSANHHKSAHSNRQPILPQPAQVIETSEVQSLRRSFQIGLAIAICIVLCACVLLCLAVSQAAMILFEQITQLFQ